ncbi:MAG: PAS domain S-box protein [Anaerolineae bacterium]
MSQDRQSEEQLATERELLRRRLAELSAREAELGEEVRLRRAEVAALVEGARAILRQRQFEPTARAIFDACKRLTGATAGYVALLSKDGSENEVLFLDSGGLPCAVDPSLPMPIRGLRAEAYRSGTAVYENNFACSEWVQFMPEGHAPLHNVMFAPLMIGGQTVGLIGLANKPGGFSERDAELATAFGELAAVALQNSRSLEVLQQQSHDLGERLKELSCLYTISRIAHTPGISLQEMLQAVVEAIPPGWQYPEITCARIKVEAQVYQTANYERTSWRQAADITTDDTVLGQIEVCYLEERPPCDEGPFLKEERNLLQAIAERLAASILRRRAEQVLQENEQRYHTLYDSISDAVFLIDNETGQILEVNAAAVALYGYTREELLQLRNTDLSAQPEETGRATRSGLTQVPLRSHRKKDGTVFPVEINASHFVWRGRPVHIAAIRDISERQRAERMRQVLYDISEAACASTSLEELGAAIHGIIQGLMPARNLYVALLDRESGEVSFPYFVDEWRQQPQPRKGTLGITEYVLRLGTPLLASADDLVRLDREGEIPDHGLEPLSRSYLGVPLKNQDGQVIGAIAVRSYREDEVLTDEHRSLLEFISRQVALVLQRVRTQEALRRSEERYRLVVENAHEGVVVAQDGWLRFVNAKAGEISGYSREELLNRPFLEFIHPEDRQLVAERYRLRLQGKAVPEVYAFRLARKDGSVRWVEIRAVRIEWEGKLATLNFLRDITEQRQAEQEREAMRAISEAALTTGSLEELGAAIHNIVRGLMPAENFYVALYDQLSNTLVFPYFADQHDEILGPVPVGRGITEYVLRTGQALLASGEDLERMARQGELELRGKTAVSYLGVPLKGDSGQPIGVVTVQSYDPALTYTENEKRMLEFVSRQITMVIARKKVEDEVRRERDFAQNLLDTAQSIVLVLDTEGNIVSFNRYFEEVSGYTLAELKGKSWFDHYLPMQDRDQIRELFQRVLSETLAPVGRNPIVTKDGRQRLVEWHNATLKGADGKVTGVLATGHDITESHLLEQQLQHAQRMESIGRLAGGVAHDFNNLLTAIIGHANFALEELPSTHPVREDIAQVLAVAERASNLTRQLLAFSRRQIISPKVISLNDLILDMDKMLRRLIGEDIELVTIPAPDLLPTRVDPGQMEQVLVNLVVNSRDAMPHGGKLTMETGNVFLDEEYTRTHAGVTPGQYVMMAISDTGAGMTEEVKQHLFEPFFTTKEVGKGTGLGLATVYGIVRQHQGHIWIYSEPGEGTTFKIYLPAAEEPAQKLPRRDEVGYLPLGNETVLVVEDEPTVRRVAARILREQGYTVLEAANAHEALRLSQEHAGPIHLLLTDVVMPQMGGRELAARLKAVRPETLVLYVSGYTNNAIVHHGVLDEGTAFLQKPFTATALVRRVRDLLDGR